MKIGVLLPGGKAVRLLYGLGGAMLLIAGCSGFVLGEERIDPAVPPSSALWQAVVDGDEAGVRKAQGLLDVTRDRIAEQKGLTDAERRVRLMAMEDSMGVYVSMVSRLRDIKGRDPDLASPEAKTLLKSASAVVDRLEERDQAPPRIPATTLVSDGMKGLAVLGLFSLIAGASLSFRIGGALLRPFKALAGLLATLRAA